MKDTERLEKPSSSGFEIVAFCPGQPALVKGIPTVEEAEDDDARTGILLHKAWETEDPADLDEDQCTIYERGLELVKTVLVQWKAERVRTAEEPRECPRELRLWLNDPATGDPVTSGQLDRHYICGSHLLVLDFKSLWCRTLTPSFCNWQLRNNAVLAWREYDGIEDVRVAFVKAMFGQIDVTDYTASDLEKSEQAIMFRLWQSQQPDAQRIPGVHCRWCRGKAVCPEAAAFSMVPAVLKGAPVLDVDRIPEYVGQLAPADLVQVWQRSTIITKILDEIKARLKGMREDELRALGLRKTAGKKLDPIVNTGDAFLALAREGVSDPALWSALEFSKTSLVGAIRRDLGKTEKEARKFIDTLLEPFIEKKTSDGSLEML